MQGSANASDVLRKRRDSELSCAHTGNNAPTCSSDAIQRGLCAFEAEEYSYAIHFLTKALELPGKGITSTGAIPAAMNGALVWCVCAQWAYGASNVFASFSYRVCATDNDLSRRQACPSEAEERAALYNLACCYSRLDEIEAGIAVLTGLLEAGFEELDMLRSDERLTALRHSPDFEELLVGCDLKHPGAVVLYGGRKRRKSIDERPTHW